MPDAPPIETLRVHQANERTMLAWMRTGIALMAFGFAIARFGLFLRQLEAAGRTPIPAPAFGSSWLGVALVAAGFTTNAAATYRFVQVRRDIEAGHVGAPNAALAYVLGVSLSVIGVAMMWLMIRAVSGT